MQSKYLLIYIVRPNKVVRKIANKISEKLNFDILSVTINENNGVTKFIEYLSKSSAIITDSFHGTIFSILFNKPFLTFLIKETEEERLLSLNNTFNLGNRLFKYSDKEKLKNNIILKLLKLKPNINKNILRTYREKSLCYLYQNLYIPRKL